MQTIEFLRNCFIKGHEIHSSFIVFFHIFQILKFKIKKLKFEKNQNFKIEK
jgi:hypothetical protein